MVREANIVWGHRRMRLAAGFAQDAEAADAGCPFSVLIKASATVTVDTMLGGDDGD